MPRAFEALLLMARHNVHHVPVLDGQRMAGMVTATDLTQQHSTSAVYMVGEIHKQESLDGLVAAGQGQVLAAHLAHAGASAYSTGHIITAITDAITAPAAARWPRRALGPAPVDYCLGGRRLAGAQRADGQERPGQLPDPGRPLRPGAARGPTSSAGANFVCDGLNACGYVYCPGEMMARTDTWRQPRRRWAEYFRRWVDDARAQGADADLRVLRPAPGLRPHRAAGRRCARGAARTRGNRLFLAHMVNNALSHRPPLGLFGGISTIKSGEHKRDGRPQAQRHRAHRRPGAHLRAGGWPRGGQHPRPPAAGGASGEISEQSAHDLRDALEFMASVLRIRHQARQIESGAGARTTCCRCPS
jgi:CBS domain-containing protein